MPEENDYYAILEVPRDASEAEIAKAYRKMALRYHPDKHVSASPEVKEAMAKRFRQINHAYEVLSDNAQRAQYDQFGAPSSDGVSRTFVYDDIEEVFKDLTSHVMSALNRGLGSEGPSAGTLALSGAFGAFCGFLLGSAISSDTSTIPVSFYTAAGAALGSAAPIVYPAVQEAISKLEGPQRSLLLNMLLQTIIAFAEDKDKH
mmetsp:Transcript_140582/g.244731  ORF Transcript_140582/g.244731 Transcript_140582/m.244731 type:complete len:203 (-) Transcript_140582:1968-2576(-)